MENERVRRIYSQNPDPQEKLGFRDDITPIQEQQTLPDRLPQSLIEWLANINRRHLAQPGKEERYQLDPQAALGMEVCCEFKLVILLLSTDITTTNERIE